MNNNKLNSLPIMSQEYDKWYNEKELSRSNKLVEINDNNWLSTYVISSSKAYNK